MYVKLLRYDSKFIADAFLEPSLMIVFLFLPCFIFSVLTEYNSSAGKNQSKISKKNVSDLLTHVQSKIEQIEKERYTLYKSIFWKVNKMIFYVSEATG